MSLNLRVYSNLESDMEREVSDPDGTTWTCVQAVSGISNCTDNKDAAQFKGQPDAYWVVCTPNGGAKSVRLQLPEEWDTYADQELLNEIKAQQAE